MLYNMGLLPSYGEMQMTGTYRSDLNGMSRDANDWDAFDQVAFTVVPIARQ